MADRLRVTELDFDTIKQNLKNFLRQQSEFVDYDFEGSSLSILLDILAYNTHYQAYYLNMVANESFLDSALLRDSVVSHAKTLGYTPYSRNASVATINFNVQTNSNTTGTLTIPKGYRFLSNQIDGVVYNFIVLEDTTVTKSGNTYYFENLDLYEGQLSSYRFVYDEQTNVKQVFTLPERNIDTKTITVTVSPSVGNTNLEVYNLVKDVTETTSTSAVYFLQETRDDRYQIYFGDDILGKKLPAGAVVTATYLITNATNANKANNFVASAGLIDSNLQSLSNFIIDPIISSNGGTEKESVDKIKYAAPLQYASQNRLVTFKDYEVFIRNSYPNIESVSVWGGEDEIPPVYGKVFVSLKPIDGYYISETQKQTILSSIVEPKSIVTVSTEFRDPEYLFIKTIVNTEYDKNRTTLNEESMKLAIKNAVLTYNNTYLNKFNSKFAISKLQEAIDDVDENSIIGSDTLIRVQKRFTPSLGIISNYTITFNVPLLQGSSSNKLTSSQFVVNDLLGQQRTVTIEEVPKSTTGINSIEILDPGTRYTSEPTITITGDGFGATARAIISLGKIQRIEILNPGIDYNQAVVTITGGGGTGASARAIIDTKVGTLRTVYYTTNAERVVVDTNVGEINYTTGIITLTDLNVIQSISNDGLIRIDCGTQNNIIQSFRNTILSIDGQDPSSIAVNLQSV